jgi:CspA family cold shock protein
VLGSKQKHFPRFCAVFCTSKLYGFIFQRSLIYEERRYRPMARGRVKWFSDQKGYGFIVTDEGQDVFVHHSNIEGTGFKTLDEDQEVEFNVVQGQKGLQAEEVVKLS